MSWLNMIVVVVVSRLGGAAGCVSISHIHSLVFNPELGLPSVWNSTYSPHIRVVFLQVLRFPK